MPLWLEILCVVLGCVLFCLIIHFILLVFTGMTIRDNIVFKNKYKRKIYQLTEKKKNIEDKINKKISYLEYKSIYCENMKILHEKNIDSAVFLTCKEFNKKEVK